MRAASERSIYEDALASALEQVWILICRAREQESERVTQGQVEAVVTTIARRALACEFRRRRPGDYKLQCAAVYILDRNPEKFGIEAHGSWLGRTKRYGIKGLHGPQQHWDREAFLRQKLGPISPGELALPELIRKLIEWHGREMLKGEVMSCLRELVGGPSSPDMPRGEDDEEPEEMASGAAASAEDTVDDLEEALQWLWQEISELPPEQRAATIFRMETGGLEALAAEMGYQAIAEKLSMPKVDLIRLARGLPLDYDRIGEMLGLTAHQARDRRARGWERIERRYRKWRLDTSCEMGLIQRWISLVDRERVGSGDAAGRT